MQDAKITKVRLEFDDGSFMELKGTEAEKWKEAVDSQTNFCYVHNMMFPKLDWVIGKNG